MGTFIIWASLAALAVNAGCLVWNVRQINRYYARLAQVRELQRLQLQICLGTWNMRHWPSAMQAIRDERWRQITEL